MYVFSKPGFESATATVTLDADKDVFVLVRLAKEGSGLLSSAEVRSREAGVSLGDASSIALSVVTFPVLTPTAPLWMPVFVAAH